MTRRTNRSCNSGEKSGPLPKLAPQSLQRGNDRCSCTDFPTKMLAFVPTGLSWSITGACSFVFGNSTAGKRLYQWLSRREVAKSFFKISEKLILKPLADLDYSCAGAMNLGAGGHTAGSSACTQPSVRGTLKNARWATRASLQWIKYFWFRLKHMIQFLGELKLCDPDIRNLWPFRVFLLVKLRKESGNVSVFVIVSKYTTFIKNRDHFYRCCNQIAHTY